MNKKKVIALIPARGGSKSLPRKNILPLNGKPLIAYSIETALKSKFIERTIVSTDDQEIKNIALKYGAEVPFTRPKNISDDKTTDLPVFEHCIETLKDKFDLIVHLTPTSPVRKVKIVDSAIEKFISEIDNGATSLRSVSYPKDSPFKMWSIKDNKLIQLVKVPGIEEPYNEPRQQLPLVYWQNGYVDIIKVDTIIKMKSMVGKKVMPFLVSKESHDIDYRNELKFIKKNFFKIKYSKKKILRTPS